MVALAFRSFTLWSYDPENGVYTFIYDPNGNLKHKAYPNNEVADYSYDELDRVKAKLENSQTGNQLYLTTYRRHSRATC